LARLPKAVKLPSHCLATSPAIAQSLKQAGFRVWLPEDILKLVDVWPILWLSWQIGRRAARSQLIKPGLPFQTYSCLEWVAVAVALSRLEPRIIWMTNLYDRWAVLVDFNCRGLEVRQRQDGFQSDRKSIVMQHGIEYADFPSLYKMRKIKSIWYFHRPSALIYMKLAVHDSEKVTIDYFGSELLLQKGCGLPGRHRILMILHPMISSRMHSIVQALTKDSRFYIFAKPHPLHGQSDFRKYASESYSFIEVSDFFPEVEAVISYRSALATEYEASRTSVLYIEDDTNNGIVQNLFSQLI
jgi:hypothetical protein